MAQRGKRFHTAGRRHEGGHVKTGKQKVGLFLCVDVWE